jgi:hypothetical protein
MRNAISGGSVFLPGRTRVGPQWAAAFSSGGAGDYFRYSMAYRHTRCESDEASRRSAQ